MVLLAVGLAVAAPPGGGRAVPTGCGNRVRRVPGGFAPQARRFASTRCATPGSEGWPANRRGFRTRSPPRTGRGWLCPRSSTGGWPRRGTPPDVRRPSVEPLQPLVVTWIPRRGKRAGHHALPAGHLSRFAAPRPRPATVLSLQARRPVPRYAVRSIRRTRRPQLLFHHQILPHVPWEFLPSGRRYREDPTPWYRGLSSLFGFHDVFLTNQNQQRHLLQVGFVDREIDLLLSPPRASLASSGVRCWSLRPITGSASTFRCPIGARSPPGNIDEVAPALFFVKAAGAVEKDGSTGLSCTRSTSCRRLPTCWTWDASGRWPAGRPFAARGAPPGALADVRPERLGIDPALGRWRSWRERSTAVRRHGSSGPELTACTAWARTAGCWGVSLAGFAPPAGGHKGHPLRARVRLPAALHRRCADLVHGRVRPRTAAAGSSGSSPSR